MRRSGVGPIARTAALLAVAAIATTAGCAPPTVTLHAPRCAPCTAREAPTRVEVEPLTTREGAAADSTLAVGHPEPAEVLTSGLKEELAARALAGGAPGGYRVRCGLDRFALRARTGMVGSVAAVIVYVDLACAVEARETQALVWRGALRGRSLASGRMPLSGEAALVQSLADRAMSDVVRELASDLAVRVLGLGGAPSARVFADEAARASTGGVDDAPFGGAALSEARDKLALVLPSLGDLDPQVRAAAWNAVAMAMGPREPWLAPDTLLDDDPTVRFYQYKALARTANARALAKLEEARAREDEAWLRELLGDALATGGLGLPRSGGP